MEEARSMNPVHEHNGKWFFWDETWTECHGPFESEEEANTACERYAREVLG